MIACGPPTRNNGDDTPDIDAPEPECKWLRPAWLELELSGRIEIPATVRAGSGFTRTMIHRGSAPKLALTGHGESPIKIAPRSAPRAPVATIVLADPLRTDVMAPDLSEKEETRGGMAWARAIEEHQTSFGDSGSDRNSRS